MMDLKKDVSLVDLASSGEDSTEAGNDDSVTIIDDEPTTCIPGKKKKKRKRNKNKKKLNTKPAENVGNDEFIVLDSTGFSSQTSDKDETNHLSKSSVNNCQKEEKNVDDTSNAPIPRRNSLLALFEKPKNIDCDDLFQVDTAPSTRDLFGIPKYRSKHDGEEIITGDEDKTEKKNSKPRGGLCWNCGQDGHQIRDCKKKRNPSMINKFRMEAMARKAQRSLQSRYHEDETNKYGDCVPGLMSKELRKALGLKNNQLPPYIYRMRVLGYPPGWMEEAKVTHSGINMFDLQGIPVSDPNDEEGEIVNTAERDKFDLNKLVEFPGFNVPPPADTIDESDMYQVPEMLPEHSLESLIAKLKPKAVQAYRRRKLAMMESTCDNDIDYSDPMETEDIDDGGELPEDSCRFVPSLPVEKPPTPPPPPLESDDEEGDSEEGEVEEGQLRSSGKSASSSRSVSPSLTQLESYKNELLHQLNTTSASGAHRTPNSSLGLIKSVNPGTPVLKLSPYQQLPSLEKFKENVSDVINFENLPDSTGKYDSLIPIINKVKKVMSKINQLD